MKRLSLLLVAALVVAGSHASSAQVKSTMIERVIVRVNGEILTQSELTQRQIDVIRDKATGPLTDAALQEQIEKLTPEVLVESVDELLLVQRGREMGAKYTDDEFKQSLDEIKKSQKMDDAKFQAALAQEGMTIEQLRTQLERMALRRAVTQREIGPSMSITQEEQRQYYQKHQDQFMTPATVTLRELFISVPSNSIGGRETVSPAADAAARTKMDALRARAAAGEDFVKLVTDNSEAASKSIGGMVGPFVIEDLNSVLKDAIATLQPGQVTEAIKGAKGYQIFKLESRATSTLKPFDLVRSQISSLIINERIDPETEKMVARLRTQAVIEWKDPKYKEIYEKAIAKK